MGSTAFLTVVSLSPLYQTWESLRFSSLSRFLSLSCLCLFSLFLLYQTQCKCMQSYPPQAEGLFLGFKSMTSKLQANNITVVPRLTRNSLLTNFLHKPMDNNWTTAKKVIWKAQIVSHFSKVITTETIIILLNGQQSGKKKSIWIGEETSIFKTGPNTGCQKKQMVSACKNILSSYRYILVMWGQ